MKEAEAKDGSVFNSIPAGNNLFLDFSSQFFRKGVVTPLDL